MCTLIGRMGKELCLVAAVAAYLVVRGGISGPFFWFSSGTVLSRELLIKHMRTALLSYSMDLSKYSGHSFWIGLAVRILRLRQFGSSIKEA